jgi:hypothetical protein
VDPRDAMAVTHSGVSRLHGVLPDVPFVAPEGDVPLLLEEFARQLRPIGQRNGVPGTTVHSVAENRRDKL